MKGFAIRADGTLFDVVDGRELISILRGAVYWKEVPMTSHLVVFARDDAPEVSDENILWVFYEEPEP